MTTFDLQFTTNPGTIKAKAFVRKRKIVSKKEEPTKTVKTQQEPVEKINKAVTLQPKPTKTQTNVVPIKDNKKKQSQNESRENIRKELPKRKETVSHTSVTNNSDNGDQKLVKRKAKKDKLANAKAAREGLKPTNTKQDKLEHKLFSEKNKTNNIHNIRGVSVVEKVFSKAGKFSDLNIHKYVVSNLEKHGFSTLTNVQEKAIPVVLEGGDVLVRSQTGSGKTLVYSIPIIDALQSITPRLERQQGLQALIVVPTRELALQTHEIISKICVSITTSFFISALVSLRFLLKKYYWQIDVWGYWDYFNII